MMESNKTLNWEFYLQGFQGVHNGRMIIFLFFLVMYLLALAGNTLIIAIVVTSHILHSPMYIFICNLSFVEIIFTSNIFPNLLSAVLTEDGTISVEGCFIQIFLFGCLSVTECLLLTIMSFDRYLAICIPLQYYTIMDFKLCTKLFTGAWAGGFILSMASSTLVIMLTFCGPYIIDHYFCDFLLVLKLSCFDTTVVDLETKTFSVVVVVPSLIFVCFTYFSIIKTINKIPSSTGKQKAISTCSSHLTVVSMYYGSLIAIYVAPKQEHFYNMNKTLSLLYTVVTPISNPIIYSLRNQEMKNSFAKIIRQLFSNEQNKVV
ncbi:olfactory receptor 11A1-like [Hyla sarda]|uniref:olfactory receptor 11A1-like n=1 Tax=Hyla sarda TaxID=327740 RepID=UPI0024C46C08|nr:olfactory receptor 11A1-like [Hyla sarda]